MPTLTEPYSITAHEVAYLLENAVTKRLRSLKVPKAISVAKDLLPELMDLIPTEAFAPATAQSRGYLFFHGDCKTKRIRETQEMIVQTHINLKEGIPITLYLSTFGGDVEGSLALASTIQEVRRAGRKVNVHIQGAAYSMGSIIAQVADVRSIEPTAFFMLHEFNTSMEVSKTSEVLDRGNELYRMEQSTFALYSARTGKPISYYREKLHRRDWFLTAKEALTEKLVDRIKPTPAYKKRATGKGGSLTA